MILAGMGHPRSVRVWSGTVAASSAAQSLVFVRVDQDIAEIIYDTLVGGQDDRRGIHLHDDRRPGNSVAGGELAAVVDFGRQTLPIHINGLPADGGNVRARTAFGEGWTFDHDALALHRSAQSDQLVLMRQGEREQAFVLGIEPRGECTEAAAFQLAELDVDAQAEPLAAVAHLHFVCGAQIVGVDTLGLEGLRRLTSEIPQYAAELGCAGIAECPNESARAL